MTLLHTPHTITEMNELRDRAYAEARTLRAQAIRDFWRGADGLLQSATQRAERAARRLAARLKRHRPAPRRTTTAEEAR